MINHQTSSYSRKKQNSDEFYRKPELNPQNTKGRITKDPNPYSRNSNTSILPSSLSSLNLLLENQPRTSLP
ncbi:hypothetical protein LPTSP4_09650 [Leptospira ryugenii]|uniref:Uncharacterized protein n=1 Tax=Leptospira ryugenii TaxID=1917863 RepID=A0A2P2DXU7_9LEPT|nr:hypothetical protein [Leptospira ryugenii]GBF49452.1 hypothetical protein LPTSP4_09650 [Leptospira ryugenii]